MTNLEYYKDEIEERFKQLFKSFTDTSSLACALDETYLKHRKQKYESMFTWYFEEHEEPIKLKRWEYDLLKCYQETKDNEKFVDHYTLKEMQYKGHFQDVDYNLTIEEILDNCEVVD